MKVYAEISKQFWFDYLKEHFGRIVICLHSPKVVIGGDAVLGCTSDGIMMLDDAKVVKDLLLLG